MGGWGSALLPSNGSHEKIQKIRAPDSEAPLDPFAPGDAAECEALEKAQQKMLKGQRIIAHPRAALFPEQFEKQTRKPRGAHGRGCARARGEACGWGQRPVAEHAHRSRGEPGGGGGVEPRSERRLARRRRRREVGAARRGRSIGVTKIM